MSGVATHTHVQTHTQAMPTANTEGGAHTVKFILLLNLYSQVCHPSIIILAGVKGQILILEKQNTGGKELRIYEPIIRLRGCWCICVTVCVCVPILSVSHHCPFTFLTEGQEVRNKHPAHAHTKWPQWLTDSQSQSSIFKNKEPEPRPYQLWFPRSPLWKLQQEITSHSSSWTLQRALGVLELDAEVTHTPPLCETKIEHFGARFRGNHGYVAPTCECLDSRTFKEASRAVLVVPVIVPAVVDGVNAAVLLLQLHVVELRGHCRHHYLFCLTQRHVNMDKFRPRPSEQTGGQPDSQQISDESYRKLCFFLQKVQQQLAPPSLLDFTVNFNSLCLLTASCLQGWHYRLYVLLLSKKITTQTDQQGARNLMYDLELCVCARSHWLPAGLADWNWWRM